jgi:hypothetical protein
MMRRCWMGLLSGIMRMMRVLGVVVLVGRKRRGVGVGRRRGLSMGV